MAIVQDEYVNVFRAEGVDSTLAAQNSLTESVNKLGTALSAIAGIAAFEKLTDEIIGAAKEIDAAFDNIRARTGQTGEALEGLQGVFTSVFASVPTSAREASDAISILSARTGATGKTLEELTATELKLANMMGGDLASQLNNTTRLFGDWGIKAEQAAGSLDILFRAAQQTGVGVDRLSQLMVQFGAPMRTLGFSFEQAAALLGKFEKEGVNTELVMGSLRIALGKMAKEGVKDPAEAFVLLTQKIKDARTEGEATTLAFEAFGRRAGVDMAKAIREGRFAIDELFSSIKNGQDTIAQAARDTLSFSDKMEILKNQATLAIQPLGAGLTDALEGLMPDFQALLQVVKQVGEAFQNLPESTRETMVAFTLLGAAVGGLIITVGGLVAVLGGPLTAALVAAAALGTMFAVEWGNAFSSTEQGAAGFRDAVDQAAKIIGTLMDITGVATNMIVLMWQSTAGSIINAVKAIAAAVSGNFAEASRLIVENQKIIDKAWANIDADIGGRWAETMQGMVQTAYTAVNQFGAAGAAAGSAYSAGFMKHLSIGPGAAQGGGLFGGITSLASAKEGKSKLDEMVGSAAASAGSSGASKFLDSLGKGLKGGGGVGKIMVDAFQDGVAGFEAAVSKIGAGAGLDKLFDPITKQAKAGAEQTKNALEAIAKGINEFLKAAGANATVTVAELAANYSKFTDVIGKTDAFEKVKAALAAINVDRAVAGLQTLDTSLTVVNGRMQTSGEAVLALGQKFPQFAGMVDASLPKVADTAKITSMIWTKSAEQMSAAMDEVSARTAQATSKSAQDLKDLAEASKKAADEIRSSINISMADFHATLDIHSAIESAISDLEKYGAEILHLTGDALDVWVKKQAQAMLAVQGVTKEGLNKIIDEHQAAAIRLPGIWDSVFSKMSAGAKSWASSIFGVLDSIPGAFGQAVKKTTDTISQWMKFFDSILGLLHKFVDAIPASIGDAIGPIGGIFKQAGTAANDMSHSLGGALANASSAAGAGAGKISDSMKGMSDNTKRAFGIGAEAATGFAMSLSLAANSGSKAMGFLQATISSTLAGIAAGFQFGPVAGAIVGGISLIGGIIGMFKGKSAAQKQQEALQLQQLKDQVAQDAQNIVNTALDGFNKALDFLNKLDDFTAARKANFRAFFAQLTKLMDWFVELAKVWGKDTLDKAKAFADALGPIVDAIANAPAALESIGQYIPLAASSVERFFADLGDVVTRMGTLADTIANDLQKRARKFAERVLPVTDVLKSAVEGLAGIINFAGVPEQAMDLFGDSLKMAVIKMTQIADSLDQSGVKAAARFADRAGVVTNLLKSGVEGLMALMTLTPIAPGVFDTFFEGLKAAMVQLGALADTIDDETLGKAVAIANAINPIAGALKAWADASQAVKGYASVTEETWTQITADFNRALYLIDLMLASAIDYIPKAQQFQDAMTRLATLLSGGLSAFSGGLTSAASQFGAVVGAIEGGIPFPGASGSAGFTASSLRSSGAAPSAPLLGGATIVQHIYPSPGMDEQALADMVARESAKVMDRRSRGQRLQIAMTT